MTAEDNHHVMYRLEVAGVTQIVTRVSHGVAELDDYLMSRMAKQCVLQYREFLNLVDCPLSQDAWIELIAERCRDGHNPFFRG